MTDPRARIPGVDRLLDAAEAEGMYERWPLPRLTEALRHAVSWARQGLAPGADGFGGRGEDASLLADPSDPAPYLSFAERWLTQDARPSLRPVINATGVVLHTNLGRAPLAAAALQAMHRVSSGYANLEYSLEAGRRGSRYDHCARLLAELTGAEDALVVNNCAGGLVLALNGLARGRDVVVSRGELVEIGGGFRVPEIMEQAGAGLREVGATNRTRTSDYAAACAAGGVAALMKVHRSNFRISGFTEEATLDDLAPLAEQEGVPLIHDLGSGLLADHARLGLPAEPTPAESIRRGAHVVIFSGDKLLGGPQAGLIVGARPAIARLRRSPLCRALRVDKATLAALEATLRLYREGEAAYREIPVLRMLDTPVDDVMSRGEALRGRLLAEMDASPEGRSVQVEVTAMSGRVGGGTFPEVAVASGGLRITSSALPAARLEERLRAGDTPIIARVEDGAVLLDLRTVHPDDDRRVAALVRSALSHEE